MQRTRFCIHRIGAIRRRSAKMTRVVRLAVSYSLAMLLLPVLASAQGNLSTLAGTGTDESKAVLPGATITATELSTGREFTAISDERGEYRIGSISPGRYKIQAEISGFSTVVNPSVEFLVGQNLTL